MQVVVEWNNLNDEGRLQIEQWVKINSNKCFFENENCPNEKNLDFQELESKDSSKNNSKDESDENGNFKPEDPSKKKNDDKGNYDDDDDDDGGGGGGNENDDNDDNDNDDDDDDDDDDDNDDDDLSADDDKRSLRKQKPLNYNSIVIKDANGNERYIHESEIEIENKSERDKGEYNKRKKKSDKKTPPRKKVKKSVSSEEEPSEEDLEKLLESKKPIRYLLCIKRKAEKEKIKLSEYQYSHNNDELLSCLEQCCKIDKFKKENMKSGKGKRETYFKFVNNERGIDRPVSLDIKLTEVSDYLKDEKLYEKFKEKYKCVYCPKCDKHFKYGGEKEVECTKCECWFHSSCGKMAVEEDEDEPWYCDACTEYISIKSNQ
eukprot:Pgem_evm1s9173